MECAGRAKRRRRFPSFRGVHKFQSGVALALAAALHMSYRMNLTILFIL